MGGDDPGTVSDGTITVTGLTEGSFYLLQVSGGDCELSVRWTVHDSGGKLLTAIHTSVQSVTEGERPEDIVAAMSGSLAALAAESEGSPT